MSVAYAHGVTDVPLRGETIGEARNATVSEHGGREALVSCAQGIRWTYAELDAQVERCPLGVINEGLIALRPAVA
jgi:fatty-acyl-CoA synthase